MVEAFVKALPQIVSHQEMVNHIRNVAENVAKDQVNQSNEATLASVARRMWSEAEPEVTATVTSLVEQSRKTLDRAFKQIPTPPWETQTFRVEPQLTAQWITTLEKGDVFEFRPLVQCGLYQTPRIFDQKVIGPDKKNVSELDVSKVKVGGPPKRFHVKKPGEYHFIVFNHVRDIPRTLGIQ
jgi:hypothetical protein